MTSLIMWMVRVCALSLSALLFLRVARATRGFPLAISSIRSQPAATPGGLKIKAGQVTYLGECLGEGGLITLSGGSISLGRTVENEVIIQDAFVSSHHARISSTGMGLFIEDLGAKNPTTINGKKLHGTREIGPGDEIIIGNTIFVVVSR